MTDQGTGARIELWLGELRLPSMRRDYRKVAKEVATAGGDFVAYLHTLLEEEVTDRRARRVQRRIKEARFPQLKRLSDLDAAELPGGISLDLYTLRRHRRHQSRGASGSLAAALR